MRILIDGPDGAGKTTLIKSLRETLLADRGIHSLHVNDPNHTLGAFGRAGGRPVTLRDIIMRPVDLGTTGLRGTLGLWSARELAEPLPPDIARLLILAGELWTDRVVSAQLEKDPDMVVFHDRGVTSTVVYQALTQELDGPVYGRVHEILKAYLDSSATKFDATFLLIPSEENERDVFMRTRNGEDEKSVFAREDEAPAYEAFQKRVRAFRTLHEYLISAHADYHRYKLNQRLGVIQTIDPIITKSELHDTVLQRLEPLLNEK